MSAGLIDKSIFYDIANAIREQNGSATTYKPSEMAAAVTALDGTKTGDATTVDLTSGTGVISDSVFTNIADAIRGQNGLTTTYKPGEMAAAIRALSWDTGIKARALLLDDGTLEFNYRDGRSSDIGTITAAYTIGTEAFASNSDCPWRELNKTVTRVVIDADFAGSDVTNANYWFSSFSALTEVSGFENLSSVTDLSHMFVNCDSLQTVYATSFDNSSVNATSVFYGCMQLVGGDGFAPSSTSAKECLVIGGSSGALTDPNDDHRVWYWGTVYNDGSLEISANETVDSSRTVVKHGRACAQGIYQAASAYPWYKASFTTARILEDMASCPTDGSINLVYGFYNCSGITSFEGLGNLRKPVNLNYCFSGCTGITQLDLRGLDPSCLKKITHTFSQCSSLTTILVDATWELPSGCSGTATFYKDTNLVGGNGTVWDSNNINYKYAVIDKEGQTGYLTAG